MGLACQAVGRLGGATRVDLCQSWSVGFWFFGGRFLVFCPIDRLMVLALNGATRQTAGLHNRHLKGLLDMAS